MSELFQEARQEQARAAADRMAGHAEERVENVEALAQPGGRFGTPIGTPQPL